MNCTKNTHTKIVMESTWIRGKKLLVSTMASSLVYWVTSNCFKRKEYIVFQTGHFTDPLPPAFCLSSPREGGRCDLDISVQSHLEKPKSHAETQFVDFSSPFNTLPPKFSRGHFCQWISILVSCFIAFIIYLKHSFTLTHSINFADDTALVCLQQDGELDHGPFLDSFFWVLK